MESRYLCFKTVLDILFLTPPQELSIEALRLKIDRDANLLPQEKQLYTHILEVDAFYFERIIKIIQGGIKDA